MRTLFFFLMLFIFSCVSNDSQDSPSPQEEASSLQIMLDRSDVIWGFDFLPDRRIIFTERSGQIFILNEMTGDVTNITGAPEVASVGEGGLLDLKLHPFFSDNNLVYLCYTTRDRSQALGRGTLAGNTLQNFQQIFKTIDSNNSTRHFGCRIEFQDNDSLYLSIGDQVEDSKAQELTSHLGKILKLNDDGTAAPGNPFIGNPNALPEIWSLGHRNPQGLAIRPGSDRLYATEHGPTGGDELNLISSGENYGWPRITLGEPVGDLGRSAPGFIDPLESWSQAIAPSGIAFFQDDLYIATLRGEHIRRLNLNGTTVSSEELLFENENLRFRTLRVGPDGLLYFSTDDGKLGRVRP